MDCLLAKNSYSIPLDINKGQVDRQFQLKIKSQGIKLTKRPVTMLTLFIWLFAGLALLFLLFNTFIGKGSIFGAIVFSIGYVVILFILSKQDASKRYGYELLAVYIEYVLRKTREVILRKGSDLEYARKFFGVKTVEKTGYESGLIRQVDGRWARIYVVAGTASAMLYPDDQARLLDKTAAFYKSFDESTDIIFDTGRELQRVDYQLIANDQLKRQVYDKQLLRLFDEQEYYMKVGIGGYKDPNARASGDVDSSDDGYYSIHQYMMLISDSKQSLYDAENEVFSNFENDGYVFKYVRPLEYDDVVKYYKELFN